MKCIPKKLFEANIVGKIKQTIFQKRDIVEVTAFKNTAISVVKKAQTSVFTENMKKGSVSYKKAT